MRFTFLYYIFLPASRLEAGRAMLGRPASKEVGTPGDTAMP